MQSAQVLAVAPSGPAGILRPGQSGQLTLTLLSNDTINNDAIPVQVGQIEAGPDHRLVIARILAPAQQHSDRGLERHLDQPDGDGRHDDRFLQRRPGPGRDLPQRPRRDHGPGQRRRQRSGRSWSRRPTPRSRPDPDLGHRCLSADARAACRWPSTGPSSSTIDGRYRPGLFGLGWATSWQTSLSVDASGNVTIDSGGALSYFASQANGSYLDTDGEYGTLTQSGGIFTFTATSGTQYVFLPNGLLNYEQDTNGNRITLGYNAQNQLVSADLLQSRPILPSRPSS